MKTLALGFLLAFAVSSDASIQHADGSLTFSAEESAHLTNNVRQMASDLENAVQIIRQLQKKIESVEKAKCI